MTRMMYWTAVMRIAVTFSSRPNMENQSLVVSRQSLAQRAFVGRQPIEDMYFIQGVNAVPGSPWPTTNDRRLTTASRPLLEAVQDEIQKNAQNRIREA